jgi:putative hydrolase of the HAD superfamily
VSVEAILFDADGVVQRPTADRQAQWRALVGGVDEAVKPFKLDIFTVERPCHDGSGDFVSALRDVLAKWNCCGSVEDALRAWTAIHVDQGVIDLIAKVRATGVPCHLATNQERYRARHMREVLGYGKAFDRLFISCEMGCSKPDPAYFGMIVQSLNVAPDAILFIDDVEANVAAAETVGIRAELFAPESPETAAAELHRILAGHQITVGSVSVT